MTDAPEADLREPILAIIAEVQAMPCEDLAKLIRDLRENVSVAERNIDRLSAATLKAEGDATLARAELRAACREHERVDSEQSRKIADLERSLRQSQETAAEMRGRLKEARSNQMVRRGDVVRDDLYEMDSGVPF